MPVVTAPRTAEHIDEYETAWERWSADLPPEVLAEARKVWEGSIEAKMIDLRHAWRGFTAALRGK